MITIIPIEPINEAYGGLIVEAFNKLFIDRGGQMDGDGGGFGNGGGWSSGGKCPEDWRTE
jgi:hypothetical protein